jgi:hypothetical protein
VSPFGVQRARCALQSLAKALPAFYAACLPDIAFTKLCKGVHQHVIPMAGSHAIIKVCSICGKLSAFGIRRLLARHTVYKYSEHCWPLVISKLNTTQFSIILIRRCRVENTPNFPLFSATNL